MIHITHEGMKLRNGLNIGWGRFFGFRLIWRWASIDNNRATMFYLRITRPPHFGIIYRKHRIDDLEKNTIETFISSRFLCVVTRDVAQDHGIPAELEYKI